MINRTFLFFCLTILSVSAARGADLYWDGSSNGSWGTISNWSTVLGGGTDPLAVPGAADRVFFNADTLTNSISTLGGAQAALGLVFNGNASAGTTLGTLNDFLLTLGTDGVDVETGSHLINSSLALSGNQTWSNSGSGTLTAAGSLALNANLTLAGTGAIQLSGAITANGNRILTLSGPGPVTIGDINTNDGTARIITLNTAASADVSIDGVISNSGAIHKDGAGLLTLNGANSFTGNLRILDGTVKVNTSNTTSGQLIFGNASGAAGSNGFGTLTLDNSTAVSFRLGGTLYVHTTSDGAVINMGGSGSAQPTVGLFGTRTFIVNDTEAEADLLVTVGIANGDASARALIKQSIGTMVMQGVNTYTGTTSIERGRLVLDYSVNNGDDKLSNTAAVNLRGGILELQGNASASTSETAGSLVVERGNSTLHLISNGGQDVTLNVTGISRSLGAGVVNITSNDPSKTHLIAPGGAANGADGILGGWATVNGTRWATKSGTNEIVALAGTVQNDKQLWTASDHLIVNGALSGTLETNEVRSLIFDAASATSLDLDNVGKVLTLSSTAILVTPNVGAQATAISGGQLMANHTAGGQTAEMIFTNLSAGTLTVSTNLGSNNTPQTGTQHLTLAGPGVILLSGSNNNINGNTFIQGNVRVSGGQALSDYGTLTFAAGGQMTTVGAVLDLNGGTESVGNLAGGTAGDDTYAEIGRGEIRLGTGGGLTVNQTGISTNATRITGTNASLTKLGNGSLTMTSQATMTGTLNVLGGAMNLTGSTAGFTSVNTIRLRGGQLLVEQNQSGTTTVNKINNTAAMVLEGTTGDGFSIGSNQNNTRTETAGSLNLAASASTITLNNTAASTTAALTTFAFGATTSFTRSNAATLLVRGINLGGSASASSAATRVTFSNATAINAQLIGTSTTAGSTTLKILPFALGDLSLTGAGNTFLTVDSSVGNSLRPLTNAEYANNYATAAADANLSLAVSASGLASKTLNALRISSDAGAVTLSGNSGTSLSLTSGGLLVTAGGTTNAVVISGFDTILAGTPAAGNDELIVHVTSSNTAAAAASLTLHPGISDNGGATSLTKSGAGTLVLAGTNTYSGTTTVNQGVLEFGAASGNLGTGNVRISGGTLRWGTGNTTDITAGGRSVDILGPSIYLTPNFGGYILGVGSVMDVGANTVTLANAIGNGGTGGLTKTGTGTLTLDTAPTYTGATVVNQGTMNFASIAPNTMSGLYLIQTAGVTSGTLSSTVQNGLNLQTLVVGGVYNSAANVDATLTVSGGAVNIGDGGGDAFLLIGYRDPTAGSATAALAPPANNIGTVDLSAASSVNINASQIQLGIYRGAIPSPNSRTSTGHLVLSNGTNVVTANSILMGSSPSAVVNTGTASTLHLGSGNTTINVDSFTIGGIRSRADVTIGSGGTFILRGQQGGDTGANLFIGDNDATGTGTPNNSSLNLTGAADVDIRLNLLVLGRLGASTNGGYGRGTLTYAVGSVQADTIRMAEANYTSSGTSPLNTKGTINQSGTAAMRFRVLSQGSGEALYNWQGGLIGNLVETNLTNQNVTITLNGAGNATDPTLRTFEVTAGRTATFEANAALAGAGSLTKTGTGELILHGTNTHTGNWLVSAGKVSLVDAGSLDDAAWINLNSGTMLDISLRAGSSYTSDAVISGTGTIGGAGATFTVGSNVGSINSTGVLKPGASSLTNSIASAATVGDQTGILTFQGDLILAASGGPRVDRALLQVGATDRNASATFTGDPVLWVDAIPTDFSSFMSGAGTNHDLLSASGTITLNGGGGISVSLFDGYGGIFGDVFNLLDWSVLSASYIDNAFIVGDRYRSGAEVGLDLLLPTLDSGLIWDTSLFKSHGALVVVPEPSRSLLMLVAGLLTLSRRRRR